jgi:chitin deacetylase
MQLWGVSNILKSQKRKNVLFDVLVWDWLIKNPKWIVLLTTWLVRPGSIIVLHDGGGDRSATVTALPLIISKLQQMNYRIISIEEMLNLYHTNYSLKFT